MIKRIWALMWVLVLMQQQMPSHTGKLHTLGKNGVCVLGERGLVDCYFGKFLAMEMKQFEKEKVTSSPAFFWEINCKLCLHYGFVQTENLLSWIQMSTEIHWGLLITVSKDREIWCSVCRAGSNGCQTEVVELWYFISSFGRTMILEQVVFNLDLGI